MDKLLELLFSFDKAPEELKKAAEEHKNNIARSRKAKAQLALWQAELQNADRAAQGSQAAFNKHLNAWSEETQKETLEEIGVKR